MQDTTEKLLSTLDALISAGQAATPGEWRGEEYEESFPESDDADYPGVVSVRDEKGRWCYFIRIDERYNDRHENLAGRDATFIALAKNALPDLIALRERVKGLEAGIGERDRVIAFMGQALDTADRMTERAYGTDRARLHPEWDREMRTVAKMRAAIATLEGKG